MDKNTVIKKLNEYLLLLKDKGIHVDKAYLFGSFAKNESTENSDIDLMLVSKLFDNENDKAVGTVWRMTRLVDSRIEPYLVGLDRFNNDESTPLIDLVKKEGILIN